MRCGLTTTAKLINGSITRTCWIPLLRLSVVANTEVIIHSNVEHHYIRPTPRCKFKVASLNIERKPGDIDVTVSHRQVELRTPVTNAVWENRHVIRLRRNFICISHFCPKHQPQHMKNKAKSRLLPRHTVAGQSNKWSK